MFDGLKRLTEQEQVITRGFKLLSCESSRPWQEKSRSLENPGNDSRKHLSNCDYSTGLSQVTLEQKDFSSLGLNVGTKPLWSRCWISSAPTVSDTES